MACALLIIATTTMVLISLHPFAFRKIFFLALALLGFSSAFCFADSLFMTRHYASSRNENRCRPPVVDWQTNIRASLIGRSFDSSEVTGGVEICSVNFANIPVGDAALSEGQLSASMVTPFDKIPVCLQFRAGVTLALAAPQSANVSHF